MLNMDSVAIRPAAIALLIAGALVAAPAHAQPAAGVMPQRGIAAATDPSSTPSPNNEAPETRAERLDRLFRELAVADPAESDRIAAEIRDIWSKSGSDSMDLLLQRGHQAMKERDYARARSHFSALTRLAPDFAEGWNAAATLDYIEKNFGRSVAEIERVIALEPRHFSALAGLALILEHVGKPEAALQTWREIARLYPTLDKAQEAIERLAPEIDGQTL